MRKNRKLNKARVFKHMARDAPDYKVVRVSRDDLLDLDWRLIEGSGDAMYKRFLGKWVRFIKIKHGEDVPIDLFADFDIDFNTYRFGGRVIPERYRR